VLRDAHPLAWWWSVGFLEHARRRRAERGHARRRDRPLGDTIGTTRTPEADELWTSIYPTLTVDRPGLIGKLLARAEAHVARLSALYALFALRRGIEVEHLISALAVWEYCTRSVEVVFAGRTGLDVADRIKAEMLPGQALTLGELRQQVFHNHVSAGKLQDALRLLVELGEVRLEPRSTGGRPATVVVRLPEEPTGPEDASRSREEAEA